MANKISGFKKFSDIKGKEPLEEADLGVQPSTDSDRPANPNLPIKTKKMEKKPSKRDVPEPQPDQPETINEEKNVKLYGKVAKFPKKTKASKAYNFLENVKISKNSIWYILIEKQDNELQMVKYNNKKGFNLSKFVSELKEFYKSKYSKNEKVSPLIESIQVGGSEEFSTIRNIPNIDIDGKKLITKITEDLIKLLSK
jgi:hypothetical protein